MAYSLRQSKVSSAIPNAATSEPRHRPSGTCTTTRNRDSGLQGGMKKQCPGNHNTFFFRLSPSARTLTILLAVTSLIVPFLHALRPRDHYLHRLAVVFLAFGPVFIILTISYEGLFYFAIAVTLVTWVRLEHRIHQQSGSIVKKSSTTLESELTTPLTPALDAAKTRETALATGDYRSLTLSDARICLFFLFLLQSAFFSTGNIASVSSFSLDAVYRLIPVFDPFSQGALLLLKLLAPFALVSANLGILTKRLRLRGGSLFAVVMGIGDYLTLRFFWEVRDEGSWLEIGESISMFVIASILCVFVAGLEALSELFVRGVEFRDDGVAERREGAKESMAEGVKVGTATAEMKNQGKKKANGKVGGNGTLNGKPNGVVGEVGSGG